MTFESSKTGQNNFDFCNVSIILCFFLQFWWQPLPLWREDLLKSMPFIWQKSYWYCHEVTNTRSRSWITFAPPSLLHRSQVCGPSIRLWKDNNPLLEEDTYSSTTLLILLQFFLRQTLIIFWEDNNPQRVDQRLLSSYLEPC